MPVDGGTVNRMTEIQVSSSQIFGDATSPVLSLASQTRNVLDDEIRRSQDALRVLKSRRNALAPISCLPPELLSRIFVFCVVPQQLDILGRSGLSERLRRRNRLKWLSVSQVCHHWREVAIDCVGLWTHLFFFHPELITTMLSRSKNGRLSVMGKFTPKWATTASLQLALGQASRIQRIDIDGSSQDMGPSFLPMFTPAPILHTLCLCTSDDDPIVIPHLLFGGQMPSLRRIRLCHCLFRWESFPLSSLTHLELDEVPSEMLTTAEKFLAVLAQMPMLEYLNACRVFNDPPEYHQSSSASSSVAIVNLPRLVGLRLTDLTPSCASILRNLRFPATASTVISCDVWRGTEDEYSDFYQAFAKFWSQSYNAEPLRILKIQSGIKGSSIRIICLHAWFTNGANDGDLPSTRAKHILAIYNEHYPSSIIGDLIRALGLAEVEILSLEEESGSTAFAWLSACHQMPQIHTVHVYSAPIAQEIFVYLRESRHIPRLRRLILHHLSLADIFLEQLVACVLERGAQQDFLLEVHIRECNISDVNVASLRQSISSLDWDGIAFYGGESYRSALHGVRSDEDHLWD